MKTITSDLRTALDLRQCTWKPTEQDQAFIDLIFSADFPWYFQQGLAPQYWILCHAVQPRPRDIVSAYYTECRRILDPIRRRLGYPPGDYLRIAINTTLYYPDSVADPHYDHLDLDHRNLLVYLNSTSGATRIYRDQDLDTFVDITAEFGRAISYRGLHTSGFPQPRQRRTVLVATFEIVTGKDVKN